MLLDFVKSVFFSVNLPSWDLTWMFCQKFLANVRVKIPGVADFSKVFSIDDEPDRL